MEVICLLIMYLATAHAGPFHTCDDLRSCSSELSINEKYRSCRCDQACGMYNDCCHDANSTGYNDVEKGETRHQNLYEVASCGITRAMSTKPFYLVKKCPDVYERYHIKQLCEDVFYSFPLEREALERLPKRLRERVLETLELKVSSFPATAHNSSYLSYIPVAGKMSTAHFRNAFCALCNGESNFEYFSVEIYSRSPYDIRRMQNLSYVRDMVRNAQLNRKFMYHPPTAHPLRSCVPSTNKCHRNWGNNTITQACVNGATEYFYNPYDGSIYRNEECALCNYANISELRCSGWYDLYAGDRPRPHRPPYSILFDVNTGMVEYKGVKVGYQETVHVPKSIVPSCNMSDIRSNDSVWAVGHSEDNSHARDEAVLLALEDTCSDGPHDITTDLIYKFDLGLEYVTFFGNILSMTGLVIQLVLYACMPSLRNTPGKCLICFSVSLFMSQFMFTIGPYAVHNAKLCTALSIAMHYTYLVYILWMSVISFDIWVAFRSNHVKSFKPSNKSKRKTFSLYSAYAWFVPLLIVVPAVMADVFMFDIRPHYGTHFCWINDRSALLWYFAVPVIIVIIIDAIFFTMTSKSICVTSRASARLQKRDNAGLERQRFFVHIKLAVIMGLTWISAFLAALVDHIALWYIFTLLNGFQGLYICIAFVCTRKVYRGTKEALQRFASRRSRSFSTSSTKETNDQIKGGIPMSCKKYVQSPQDDTS